MTHTALLQIANLASLHPAQLKNLGKLAWKAGPYLAFLASVAYGTVFTVKPNENAAVIFGGEISRIVGPGYHVQIPLLETPQKFPISALNIGIGDEKNDKGEYAGISAITKDPQEVFVTANAEITLPEGDGLKYVLTRVPEYKGLLVNYLTQVTKAVVGTYAVDNLPEKRDEIAEKIKTGLEGYILKGGHNVIGVKSVQLLNLAPNKGYVQALEEAAAEGPKLAKAKKGLEIARVGADAEEAKADGIARGLRTKGQALREFPEALRHAEIERWNGDGVKTLVNGGPSTPTGIFVPSAATAAKP